MKIIPRFCRVSAVFVIFSLIIGIYFNSNIAFASTFSDVPYDHSHSTSISYLQSNNIVQGYPDNTFQPDNLINRVEFLKIVLEGTNVPLDVDNPTGFSDVVDGQWYIPYIRKAKYEGWIQGYPDNTFRPLNPINKVEALKILGEVQKWDTLALGEVPEAPFEDTYRFSWYSRYVYFAKENSILFEEEDFLYPSQEITRGYMAEIMYLSIINDVINYVPGADVEDTILDVKIVDTPSDFTTVNTSFFDDIQLSSPLPNTFYKNEIYVIEGEITNGITYDTIFAFLSENNEGISEYTHLIGTVDGTHFEIPLIFRDEGTYNFGIIPGDNGESKTAEVHVLDGIPEAGSNTNTDIPLNLSVNFENDTTSLSWDSQNNNVFRIYYLQDDEIQSYFVRNEKSLDIFYKDFKNFEEGTVSWRIYGAQASSVVPISLNTTWAISKDSSFEAVIHNFKLFVDDSITYSYIPEKLSSVKSINVSGVTHEDILAEGAVITPNGTIDYFNIETPAEYIDFYGNNVISAESSFNFTYVPTSTGTYILEVNNKGGSAVVNVPIYIGDIIPFIPDFFDLQDPSETTETLDLNASRKELLNYINVERLEHRFSPVSLSDELNGLAQDYSDDMYNSGYFSHINTEGQSPDDRRITFGITTDVGENLAHAPTVYFAHQALMRSAIHRQNILEQNWDNIGIGITLDDLGYLIIVEEFSHDPWTSIDLINFENDLLDSINSLRSTSLSLNTVLLDITRNWSEQMIDQNFFSFDSPSGINLIDVVQSNSITEEGRAYILKEGNLESLLDKLLSDSDILDPVWKEIGIGMKQDSWSNLYLTVIYTQ